MPDKAFETVLEQHTLRLMSLPGVVGVGHGLCAGAPCIKVLVIEKTDDLAARIGDAIKGYPVEILESGEIRALDSENPLPDRQRAVKPDHPEGACDISLRVWGRRA